MPSQSSPAASPPPRTRGLLGPLVGLAAVALLAVAAFTSGGSDPDPSDGPEPGVADAPTATAPEDTTPDGSEGPSDDQIAALRAFERRDDADPMAIGDVDAPVVMVEWADYQCPFCGSFARDTKPTLVERYVDEGVLRIEYRDLPIFGEASHVAARAARAAAHQDAFWAYHDRLFAEERAVNDGTLDRDYLLGLAEELDLDLEAFVADLDDPETAAAVEADLAEGRDLGITATPAFLVNGRPVLGGQPTEVFERLVEQAAQDAAGAP